MTVIRRLQSGGGNEDARVEMKATWIPAERAARHIAGHANAAKGDAVLWLVGVDEKKGVVGAAKNELATWWPQIQSHFDGVPPSITPVSILVEEREIVALLFDTTRFPYVVKNPAYGTPEGGRVQYEVPWREGNATRTARRDNLIELLTPVQHRPDLEVLAATLSLFKRVDDQKRHPGRIDARIYLTPVGEGPLVIPFHRCDAAISITGIAADVERVAMSPPASFSFPGRTSESRSLTIASTHDELVVEGPGRVELFIFFHTSELPLHPLESAASVHVTLHPVRAQTPCVLDLECPPPSVVKEDSILWKWTRGTEQRAVSRNKPAKLRVVKPEAPS